MHRSRTRTESVSCSPWKSAEPPRRVLVIRMHAIGDVAITLPAVVGFQEQFPGARVDFLTTQTCVSFFESLTISGKVFSFPDRLDRWGRLVRGLRVGRTMREHHYDVVIDLQRNWVSRLVRRMAAPRAWSEFERFTPNTAGERTLRAFHSAGFNGIAFVHELPLKEVALAHAKKMLLDAGWSGRSRLIVLNPAGLWETRQWPIDNYTAFARLMIEEEETHFLLLGTDRIRQRTRIIKENLGSHFVDLTERTTLGEAIAILQSCRGMVTEDSGLMHIAWASGVPVVALFGSTNHVWSAPPKGALVRCFHSGDLPCTACMQPQCKFGDVHCLTRVSPETVHRAMREMLALSHRNVKISTSMGKN